LITESLSLVNRVLSHTGCTTDIHYVWPCLVLSCKAGILIAHKHQTLHSGLPTGCQYVSACLFIIQWHLPLSNYAINT